ncbi:uncharacterized protein [Paramisgurnus dabryanus]|uniref:uncharacterized protein n=1 Tax=Paramisgurnus dabryanus TaxID=90735 RepID=UPI003CCF0CBC
MGFTSIPAGGASAPKAGLSHNRHKTKEDDVVVCMLEKICCKKVLFTMSRRCYFHPDCKSPIYGLPKDENIREQWLRFIFNSSSEHNNPNIFLCAAHFTEDSFINREKYNAGIAQMLILKNESVPTLSGQRDDTGPKPDVDCCETSVYVIDGSSSESLDSVSVEQDQPLMDKHLPEETSGPTQESELDLNLLCYSESDSDQEDESTDKTTKGSHDIVCNAEEQQEILQTTEKTSSVQLKDCRNLMERQIETIVVEDDTDDEDDDDDYDDDDDEEDKKKRYDDDDDDFVPSDESNDDDCIPSDEINDSSDEEKPHKCPYCKKRFSDTTKVKYHVRLHTKEKPYQCSICGKTFRLSCSLKSHERTHSGEQPFPCSHCGKRFSSKYYLTQHERVHTGEKPFLCQHCGKSFAKADGFKFHLRVHTGEKPHQCSQCGKRFAHPRGYKAHKQVHLRVKPYPCNICGKSFTRQDNLATHQRIHTGEKPYKCTQCDMGFTQAVLLRLHQKKHTAGKL